MTSPGKKKKWTNDEPPRSPEVSLHPPVRSNVWGSIPHVHKGIANFGNTCFFSATLQILFHNPNVVQWIINSNHLAECHTSLSCVLCNIIRTFRQIRSCRDPHIRPAAFAALTRRLFSAAPGGHSQEDAHECLVLLLKQMEEQFLNSQQVKWSDVFSIYTNPVFRIFGGWLVTKCVCLECRSVSKTYSPLTNLPIDIKNLKSVQEAFTAFFKGEEVEDYTCSQCSKVNGLLTKTTCKKSFSFHEAPSTMILQLKRFEDDRSKLQANINVDLELLASKNLGYKLAGAVLHSGPSLNSGHYLTLVQCPDKTWTEFNDSKVKKVDHSYVNLRLQESAYILFYSRTEAGCPLMDKRSSPQEISSPKKKQKIGPQETFTVFANNLGCAPLVGATSPKKIVSPINIRRMKKTVPRENSTVSLNDYIILSETHKVVNGASEKHVSPTKKPVTPIKITRKKRELPKEHSKQSSHDYFIRSQTHNVCGNTKDIFAVDLPMDEGFHDNPSLDGSPKSNAFHEDNFHDQDYSDVGSSKADDLHDKSANIMSPNDEGYHGRQMNVDEDLFSESPFKVPFVPIVLTEEEVDGAILPRKPLTANNIKALKRWLECREGLSSVGTKPELIERVAMAMANGNSHIIDPKVDGGKWYEAKAAAIRHKAVHATKAVATQSFQMTQANLEVPTENWHPFPSVDLPTMFNFGHIYFYLIESCPTMPFDDDDDDDDDDDACDSDSLDCEDPLPDPFDDECSTINEVKVLRKGVDFYKSKFVRDLQDNLQDKVYFLRAQVRASMALKAYEVIVKISKRSGSIYECTCQCVGRALGRCVHVSTVLIHVWGHIRLNGYGAMTCTSLPKVWGKGSLKRNPGPIRDTQYDSFKIDIKRRAYFDPRPTSKQVSDITQEQINTFLFDLLTNDKTTLHQKHLTMKYPEERYSPVQLKHLSAKCRAFMKNIPSFKKNYDVYFIAPDGHKVYELPLTKGQRTSKRWMRYRSIHMTGTAAYAALHLASDKSKQNFLRKHLWGLDKVQTKAMTYGTNSEEKALMAYETEIRKTDPSVYVEHQCGLLKRDDFPEAAASVDAITYSKVNRPRLVEIKCPYILRNHNPKFYKKKLKQSQKNSFCLGYSKKRGNFLRKGSPYYSQVQHYLGILGLELCDFVIWSKKGILIVEVKFDEDHWDKIKEAISDVYQNLLVPEYFLMRTPRQLEPLYFNWAGIENTLEADLESL